MTTARSLSLRRVAIVGAAAGALALAACAPTKGGQLKIVTFDCTNGAQNFSVPAGVTKINIVAEGAQGGAGENGTVGNGGAGGLGGRTSVSDIPVTPGEML